MTTVSVHTPGNPTKQPRFVVERASLQRQFVGVEDLQTILNRGDDRGWKLVSCVGDGETTILAVIWDTKN